MDFAKKTALITGGGSGIGLSIAQKLAQSGANVFSWSLTSPKEKIENINFARVDITKSEEIKSALKNINEPIGILVNNAGIMRRGSIFESSEQDWDDCFSVNLKGQWLVTKYAMAHLLKDASIVFISSIHGISLPENPALYGMAKKGVIDMAGIIQKTYPNFKIKTVCPGPINTRLVEQGRSKKELKAFQKTVKREQPEAMAEKIIELIKSDYTKLFFNEGSYHFNG